MKVTVYLNEARGASFDGFTKSTALLVEGFTFDLDRTIVPGGTAATRESLQFALEDVYTQLNACGDIYPHTEASRAYRAQGRRSLSVGDLVEVDGAGVFTPGTNKVVGQDAADGDYVPGWTEVMGGPTWIEQGLARHVAHFGDTGVRGGVMA